MRISINTRLIRCKWPIWRASPVYRAPAYMRDSWRNAGKRRWTTYVADDCTLQWACRAIPHCRLARLPAGSVTVPKVRLRRRCCASLALRRGNCAAREMPVNDKLEQAMNNLWRGSLLPSDCSAVLYLGPLRSPAGASSLATGSMSGLADRCLGQELLGCEAGDKRR